MKKIAVIMGGLVYDSQRKILESVYRRMDELGVDVYTFTCHVLVNSSDKVLSGAHEVMNFADFSDFDGIIVAPNTLAVDKIRGDIFQKARELNIPIVSIDFEMEGVASIIADNYPAMYELVEHLVTVHGKRRFFYLSGPEDNRDAKERKQAFLDVMEKYEIPIDPVQVYEGNFAGISGKLAWEFWQKEIGMLPEVFVCANDAMAQAILIQLAYCGVNVPDDVIVTGVDNSELATESEPRISGIERFHGRMGEIACDLLLRANSGEDISNERIELTSRVVLTDSCGCHDEKAIDYKAARKRHMIKSFFDREISGIIKDMISDFTGADTFDELLKIVGKYIGWADAQYFYLCMNDLQDIFVKENMKEMQIESNAVDLTKGYQEYMTVPMAYEDGVFTTYGKYKSSEILPKNVARDAKSTHYIIHPLHYQNESFGYCVFGNSNFPIDQDLCYTWILAISDAIQNVRKNMQLYETVKKLNRMWIFDTLTGVYNRAGFFHLSQPLIEEAAKEKRGMYILFMDLDGLKIVNDTYGHEAGDRFICAVANILKKVTEENELIMRYGGDEFVVLGKFREYNRAEEIMREVDAEIAIENRSGAYEFMLAVSMGHEVFNPQREIMLENVLDMADQEMYKQKRRKKERKQQKDGQ